MRNSKKANVIRKEKRDGKGGPEIMGKKSNLGKPEGFASSLSFLKGRKG
jgi:hypothetical protein